ncbi:hypothetical protein N7468_004885 [Penicillium chermesinum]|uniref:Uncharacterized protein n=1 Tax=Penicillium chermesinum TaxID=63820 RepID=A0A9W9PA20_9EURO|nr:uncharacterized protein N7468_004885 [Penicillium chermesinum]KAJ5240266.1 hypothetical protein N7468_004885 [Penicillium chermesinum]
MRTFNIVRGSQFPFERYITALAKFLDAIDYQDENFSYAQCVESLRYVYHQTAKHFHQPVEKAALNISAQRLQAIIKTSILVTVYCWAKCSLDIMVGLLVYFAYIIMLDDSSDVPSPYMMTFYEDLIEEKSQKHAFWQRMNAHLVTLLRHYGGFCAITVFRSTMDSFRAIGLNRKPSEASPD